MDLSIMTVKRDVIYLKKEACKVRKGVDLKLNPEEPLMNYFPSLITNDFCLK